jgi:hypothetical protein
MLLSAFCFLLFSFNLSVIVIKVREKASDAASKESDE